MVCFSKYPQDGQMMSLLPFGMFCRVFHGVTVAALSKFALGMGRYDTSDYHRLVKQKKAKADQVVTQLNLDKKQNLSLECVHNSFGFRRFNASKSGIYYSFFQFFLRRSQIYLEKNNNAQGVHTRMHGFYRIDEDQQLTSGIISLSS